MLSKRAARLQGDNAIELAKGPSMSSVISKEVFAQYATRKDPWVEPHPRMGVPDLENFADDKHNYSTYPFCSSKCKRSFHTKHAFDAEGYKTFFTKDRFKIWLHNQISIFTPQFTSIREDHSFRKLVRDELWAMRKEMVLAEAIYFIVFMRLLLFYFNLEIKYLFLFSIYFTGI